MSFGRGVATAPRRRMASALCRMLAPPVRRWCHFRLDHSMGGNMSTLRLPALDPATVPERRGSGYPEPFRTRMGDRVKRRLGEACGLTQFGVNLVTLGPNGQ